jgi:hypothetical protein
MGERLTREQLTVLIADMELSVEALGQVIDGLERLESPAGSASAAEKRVNETGVLYVDNPGMASGALANLRQNVAGHRTKVLVEKAKAEEMLAAMR